MVSEFVVLGSLSIFLALAIGSNDETLSPVIGVKKLTINQAVLVGGIAIIMGAATLGYNVSKTVGTKITTANDDFKSVIVILISITIVLLVASYFGLPLSTTHTTVGSIIGYALITGQADTIDLSTISKIGISWIISPVVGFSCAAGMTYIINKIRAKRIKGLDDAERYEDIFSYILLAAVILSAFSRGANDVSNAVAPMLPLFIERGQPRLALILGGTFMGIGLILFGRRVLKTLGNEVVELSPSDAVSVQLTTAIVITILAALGIPNSSTHVLIAAFYGAGVVSQRNIKTSTIFLLIGTTVLTPVVAIITTYGVYLVYGLF